MAYHEVKVSAVMVALLVIVVTTDITKLINKPRMTTEKMWLVYIQIVAILLLRILVTINSLSAVVKPVPVKIEATWNFVFFVVKPVNLKATENTSMTSMYTAITDNTNAIAKIIFILTFSCLCWLSYIVHYFR